MRAAGKTWVLGGVVAGLIVYGALLCWFATAPDERNQESELLAAARRSEQQACGTACAVVGQSVLRHPSWGTCWLVAFGPGHDGEPGSRIAVIDRTGTVRWRYQNDRWFTLSIANPAIDATGNVFLTFNPGRYDGVIVLRPIPGGFEDFGSLPAPNDYRSVFYFARVVSHDNAPDYAIEVSQNDCAPSCAEGVISHREYRWNGVSYATR